MLLPRGTVHRANALGWIGSVSVSMAARIASDLIVTHRSWHVSFSLKWGCLLACITVGSWMFRSSHLVLSHEGWWGWSLDAHPIDDVPFWSERPVRGIWKAYPTIYEERWTDSPLEPCPGRWMLHIPLWIVLAAATAPTLGLFLWGRQVMVGATRAGDRIIIRRYWHLRWWSKWLGALISIVLVVLWSRASHLDVKYDASVGYWAGWSNWDRTGECPDTWKWYPAQGSWVSGDDDFVDAWVGRIPIWMLIAVVIPVTVLLFRLDQRHYAAGRCVRCGYDLTGNASGRCPECGTHTDSPVVRQLPCSNE